MKPRATARKAGTHPKHAETTQGPGRERDPAAAAAKVRVLREAAATQPEKKPKARKKQRHSYSKMVSDRAKDTVALVSSIEAQKHKVHAGLCQRLAPGLADGEPMPDQARTLELVGASVIAALERLKEADDRYTLWSVYCQDLAAKCDRQAREEVYPRAVDVRRAIDAVFGKKVGWHLHSIQKGRILRKPWRQREQIARMVLRLKDRKRPLPKPKSDGFTIDRDAWLKKLEPAFDGLETLMDQLESDKFERARLGGERQKAMDEYDRIAGESLRYVIAVFTMAGCDRRVVRELRAYYRRRRMSRQARQKRQERAAEREARPAESPAAGEPAGMPPAAAPRSPVRSIITGWFKKSA
jgi:hypothetical protein